VSLCNALVNAVNAVDDIDITNVGNKLGEDGNDKFLGGLVKEPCFIVLAGDVVENDGHCFP
jgi:hypothetical protein